MLGHLKATIIGWAILNATGKGKRLAESHSGGHAHYLTSTYFYGGKACTEILDARSLCVVPVAALNRLHCLLRQLDLDLQTWSFHGHY